jgi:hypothetical protein
MITLRDRVGKAQAIVERKGCQDRLQRLAQRSKTSTTTRTGCSASMSEWR